MRDIIIKNACVITGEGPVFPDGFVHLRGARIAALGNSSKAPHLDNVDVIDAGGRYVLPGLINAHMHLYSHLARGISVGRMKTFGKILDGLWWRLDRALSPDDVRLSAVLGSIDAVKAGVTTLIDHHASYGAISGSLGAIGDALRRVGMRGSLCFEISDRCGMKSRDEAICETGYWLEAVGEGVAVDPEFPLRGMVGLHASMTLSDDTLSEAARLMDEHGVGAHVHVEEGVEDLKITRKKFRVTPIERFVKAGILREGSLAVHCVHANDRDLALLKRCGTHVVHNPMSNLNNAVGIAPIQSMHRKGIPVAIGTDGMSAGVSDDIRLASVIHKPAAGDAQAMWDETRASVWETAPEIVSRMFSMKIGTLKAGSAADLIIVDGVPPTPVSPENAWGHFLFGALNLPVRTTIIAGRACMRDFKIMGEDEKILAKEAQKLANALWKKIKYQK